MECLTQSRATARQYVTDDTKLELMLLKHEEFSIGINNSISLTHFPVRSIFGSIRGAWGPPCLGLFFSNNRTAAFGSSCQCSTYYTILSAPNLDMTVFDLSPVTLQNAQVGLVHIKINIIQLGATRVNKRTLDWCHTKRWSNEQNLHLSLQHPPPCLRPDPCATGRDSRLKTPRPSHQAGFQECGHGRAPSYQPIAGRRYEDRSTQP